LRIQSIPTLVIFFQGQIADMIVGALPKAQLQARLQRVLDAVAQLQTQSLPTKGTTTPPPSAQPQNRPGLTSPYNQPPQPPRRPRGR
jgi:thioredoxin-like negative regulator of GroEL